MNEERLYRDALHALVSKDQWWMPNYIKFCSWDSSEQIWWIAYIQRAAQEGLPMAVEITKEVIKLRLGGGL